MGIASLLLDVLMPIQVEMFRWKEVRAEIQTWKCLSRREEAGPGDTGPWEGSREPFSDSRII